METTTFENSYQSLDVDGMNEEEEDNPHDATHSLDIDAVAVEARQSALFHRKTTAENMAEAEQRDTTDVFVEAAEDFGALMVNGMQFADEITVAETHVTTGRHMSDMVRATTHERMTGFRAEGRDDALQHEVGLQLDVAEISREWKKLNS